MGELLEILNSGLESGSVFKLIGSVFLALGFVVISAVRLAYSAVLKQISGKLQDHSEQIKTHSDKLNHLEKSSVDWASHSESVKEITRKFDTSVGRLEEKLDKVLMLIVERLSNGK